MEQQYGVSDGFPVFTVSTNEQPDFTWGRPGHAKYAMSGDIGWSPLVVKQWKVVIRQWFKLKHLPIDCTNAKVFQWARRSETVHCCRN